METWSFPDTPERIWNSLDVERQNQIINLCATSAQVRKFKPLIEYLADRRHTRELTIIKWPSSKFESAIRGMMRANYETGIVLGAYVFEGCGKITSAIKAFADEFDTDEDGRLRPETLEGVVATLLQRFPYDDVQLCLQCHYSNSKTLWTRLPEMDFARVEQRMQELKQESEVADDVDSVGNCQHLAIAYTR